MGFIDVLISFVNKERKNVFIPISGSNIGSHMAQIFVDIHSINDSLPLNYLGNAFIIKMSENDVRMKTVLQLHERFSAGRDR